MIDNAHYTPEVHGPYEVTEVGDLELEAGGVIPSLRLAHTSCGTPNASRDNTILVTTWFAGTHGTLMRRYIGPGRALDPERYHIVIVNQIGGGLSTSPHNAPAPIAMSRFPDVGIGDDVAAQRRLLRDHYGVEDLALVVGGSMGAQQAWEWAVRHPDEVRRIAAIAGTARTTAHNALYAETLAEAITSDPGFKGGEYRAHTEVAAGLARHARMWSLMGFSTRFFAEERWRALGFDDRASFQTGVMEGYFGAMDPNNLVAMARKWSRADVSRHADGDLAAALGWVRARALSMPIDEDIIFPPRDCAAEVAHVPGGQVRVITSADGHLGLLGLDPGYIPQVDRHLRELLEASA